ncbi:MAG: hypothetical protein M1831_000163 [Alyxoria varia]|nr:MAG: hypothetical protein M1831_000163 [Alyxoria varia]
MAPRQYWQPSHDGRPPDQYRSRRSSIPDGWTREEYERYCQGYSRVEPYHERPPKSNRSDPKERERLQWSETKQRSITGYPQKLYGTPDESGSDPDVPASKRDRYRDDMIRRNCHTNRKMRAPPVGSEFQLQSNEYHRAQRVADHSDSEYRDGIRSRPYVPPSRRPNNPDVYGGNPEAPRYYHNNLGRKAKEVSDNYGHAVDTRHTMRDNFVGYDQHRGYDGHSQWTENLEDKGDYAQGLSDKHNLPLWQQNRAQVRLDADHQRNVQRKKNEREARKKSRHDHQRD